MSNGDLWVGVGRAGQDATSRFTSEGVQVTSFSLAVDRGYGDKKSTLWLRVNCWNKLAEIAAQYVTKGKLLWVEGEIQEPRVYQGRDGEHRASLDVRAISVKFLGGKSDAAQDAGGDDLGTSAIETPDEIPF